MNKGEQRRVYSSQLQKIIKKNIKNNISFSINNYNNNTTNHNQNDYGDLYKNINQNKLNEGIRGLNKSLDLSRNKSPGIVLKPSFLIKNENASSQKINNPNGIGFISNNKSVDFENYDLQKIQSLNYKNDNLNHIIENISNYIPSENIVIRNNNKFKIKKDLLDDVLSKYQTQVQNLENYSNDLSNVSSIKNQNTLTNKTKYSILHANEKSIDNYMKNPISNDSVLNMNLFGNELSESNHKINLTNINSLSEFEKLNLYKNIDSQTKNSSKYLETEDSHFNNPVISSNINKQVKINNFNDVNLSNENLYKIIDINTRYDKLNKMNLNNQGRNRPDIVTNNFAINYLETDTEVNNTSGEYGNPRISKFAKIRNFYSRNNTSKINDVSSNFINETETDGINNGNNIEKNSTKVRPSYPTYLTPLTNKNMINNKIQFNLNMNNSINTPTKLFNIPVFKMGNEKEDNVNRTSENNIRVDSFIDKTNFNTTPKKISPLNNYNVSNLNFSNSIKNRILQNSIKNSNVSPNNSKGFSDFRKILNPKIRIVSRNINERADYQPHTAIDQNTNLTEVNSSFINKTSNISLEEINKMRINNNNIESIKNNIGNEGLDKKNNIQNVEQINDKATSFKNYEMNYIGHNVDNYPSKVKSDHNNNDFDDYNRNGDNIHENTNNMNCLKSENKSVIKESSKNASTIDEDYKNRDSRSEFHKKTDNDSSQNINSCCNCKKNIQNEDYQNEKDLRANIKKEYNRPNSRNEEEREMTFNVGTNYHKNFNDIVSTTSKEVILDENEAHLVFVNKSSKNSSQKDYVISDSNELEEIEISGKLASMEYSNSTLKKKSSTHNFLRDKNEKLNSTNAKDKGSNYSLKNNLVNQASSNADSKMTILDIIGFKNSSSDPKFTTKDSEKEMIMKSNLNKNISKEDKIKIENLIRNLDNKVDSRNKNEREKEVKKKNYESKNTFKSNSSNNRGSNFGVFREVEEKVMLIQKYTRMFLNRSKEATSFERLVSFWDKSGRNLVTIMINRPDKQNNILNVDEITLKIKAFSLDTKKILEKTLTNEPFLYKLQRHRKINLRSLKDFFLTLKDNLEMKEDKILYVSEAKSPKLKDKVKKNKKKEFPNEIFEELKKAKLSDKKYKKKEDIYSVDNAIKADSKNFLTSSKIYDNETPIDDIKINDRDIIKNYLGQSINSNKINETGSIYFKDDLRNVYKNYKEENNLISITTLNSNSSISINSPSSLKSPNISNKNYNKNNNKGDIIDRSESMECPMTTNRYKEVNLSNENLLNNSIHIDSKYFYDDISTKTINTCSISDDNLESDDNFEI